MSRPVIIGTYWFASSSGSGTYETLEYEDGRTSCGCPGWTRRIDKAGNRSCKHTRIVEAGLGRTMSTNCKVAATLGTADQEAQTRQPKTKHQPTMPTPGQRKLIIPKQ